MAAFGFHLGGYTGDIVAPEIDLISPEDFSDTFSVATSTPVVIEVTDSPGIRAVNIFASGTGFTGIQAVYYNGDFTPLFSDGSSTAAITGGTRYTFLPDSGWNGGTLTIFVEAIDHDGNRAVETFSWAIELAASAAIDGNPGYPFRDSVWRWRRRLNKQKCSVISVAIDDSYSPNAGFTLTALALEIGRKQGLDRSPWRGGTFTNRSGSGTLPDGNS